MDVNEPIRSTSSLKLDSIKSRSGSSPSISSIFFLPRPTYVVGEPPGGAEGALSTIGISGDHCGPSISGRWCSQRPQYRH
ncbi:hypothetical protein Taro_012246 [Colocasia esculenta]|uniref:Uncharacterized protein n=1 Tax=Colocasia esculenta TaxID=4460 RepID=A0A843UF16_COLES|nr:hypothetical protein [Colocasia esculenta]